MTDRLLFTVFIRLAIAVISATGGNITELHHLLNDHYDTNTPPLSVHAQGLTGGSLYHRANQYHGKRCSFAEPGGAIRAFQSGVFVDLVKDQAVLVGSPCFFSDSLGNWLSNYFESIMCANAVGMHYISVAKVWEPSLNDTASAFLASLPSVIEHRSPVSGTVAKSTISSICTCAGVCHERPTALWVKGLHVIRPILWDAFSHHLSALKNPVTHVLETDVSNAAVGAALPFIPDVAIHYRCGDNFIGHYGFLPFSAFKLYIPAGAKTIYVLADKRGRKTAMKQHRAAKCDAIFSALFTYLTQLFPQAAVLIRRGGDLSEDLLRLASAPTTICSVSTFCLWPALANNHTAYFPLTKLVLRKDASRALGIKWISQPAVVLGSPYEHLPAAHLVNLLSTT